MRETNIIKKLNIIYIAKYIESERVIFCKRWILCVTLNFLLIMSLSAQWSTDPSQNLRVTNRGLLPRIISDGNGGAYIAYNDMPLLGIHIHVQRLDKYGYVQFPGNGIMVADSSHFQAQRYFLVNDNAGGVIVVFDDSFLKDEKGHTRASAQRIDSTGQKLWGENGVAVAPLENPWYLDLVSGCSDGEGGCYVFWGVYHDRNNIDLMVQHLDSQGNFMWDNTGMVVSNKFISYDYAQPCLSIADNDKGVIVYYLDDSGARLQRIDFYGQKLWGNGIEIFDELGFVWQWASIASDRENGAIVANSHQSNYGDNFGWHFNVAAQRVDYDGEKLWSNNGVVVTEMADDQTFIPQLVIDKGINSYIVWQDQRSDTSNVYAQRLNSNGEIHWQEDGIKVSQFNSMKGIHSDVVLDSDSGLIVIWRDWRNNERSIRAQRINADGIFLWQNELVVTDRQTFSSEQVASDGNGGAIVCWYSEPPDIGIYAQQINYNGELGKVIETSIKEQDSQILPSHIHLLQNYPNPFNTGTLIKFSLPQSGHVQLKIFNLNGKEVITLLDQNLKGGAGQSVWDGRNQDGDDVSSGVYFISLKINELVKTRKILLIR